MVVVTEQEEVQGKVLMLRRVAAATQFGTKRMGPRRWAS